MMPNSTSTAFKLPSDGWAPLAPFGEHPARVDGEEVVQVIDPIGARSIAANFGYLASREDFPGMLVDREHWHHDPDKETTAFGWLMNVAARPDGLYGKIRWTGTGERAVLSGDYRFLSPEFAISEGQKLGANRFRPLRLAGLSLTNAPNMKTIKPICNRSDDSAAPDDAACIFNRRVFELKKELGIGFEAAWQRAKVAAPALYAAAVAGSAASAPAEHQARLDQAAILNRKIFQVKTAHALTFERAWEYVRLTEPALFAAAAGQ